MKKIFNLNIRNIKGNPILTVLGAVAAIALPFATEHLDAETVGGAVGIFLIGALAGFKKVEVAENVKEAKETAKDYVEQRIKEGKFRNDDYGNEAVNLKKKYKKPYGKP